MISLSQMNKQGAKDMKEMRPGREFALELDAQDALASRRHRQVWRSTGSEVMRVAAARGIEPMGFNGFDPVAFQPGGAEEALDRSIAAMVEFNRGL